MACALRPDGQLKDASEIDWYNDADDNSPMIPPPPSSNGTLNGFIRRSNRATKPTEKIRYANNTTTIPAKQSRPVAPLNANDTTTIPAKRSHPVAPPNPSAPKRVFTRAEEHASADDEPPELEDITDDEEDDDSEEAYQRTKKFGDQDREDRKGLKKDERSADLTTVFSFEKGRINPHTQEREDGWWCEICKAKDVPLRQCFFKGGVSTRRTHIARCVLQVSSTSLIAHF